LGRVPVQGMIHRSRCVSFLHPVKRARTDRESPSPGPAQASAAATWAASVGIVGVGDCAVGYLAASRASAVARNIDIVMAAKMMAAKSFVSRTNRRARSAAQSALRFLFLLRLWLQPRRSPGLRTRYAGAGLAGVDRGRVPICQRMDPRTRCRPERGIKLRLKGTPASEPDALSV
jgi:hypothetical protein